MSWIFLRNESLILLLACFRLLHTGFSHAEKYVEQLVEQHQEAPEVHGEYIFYKTH